MYENIVFPGVNTIYDYIAYCKNNEDRRTYSSKADVKVWDDFEQKYIRRRFFCGCTGSELIDQSGNRSIGFRMPLVKIDVNSNSSNSLQIGTDQYIFLSDQDRINFLEFVRVYNAAIDKYIRAGIHECFRLSSRLYAAGLSLPTQNFIRMIPQQFFVEHNIYKAMLRDISWRDTLFSDYANFSMDEIKTAYNLIHHKSNEQAFEKIRKLFNDFVNVISENVAIPPELLKLTTFLLIRNGAIELFSKQWKKNYDPSDYHNAEGYIAACVHRNLVSSSDATAMTMLTYCLLSADPTVEDDYYVVNQRVQSLVSRAENQKRQENFRAQLFQTTHNADAKTRITIDDVDFMSGDEFENLVCRLFRMMGFQAYVTKHSGDQGIDVIAEKSTFKIGIQAKCYSSTVGNSAIQEAVAGRAYYGCNRVMVITNNMFTKSAEKLASANNVVLWGRDILKEKLAEYPISL